MFSQRQPTWDCKLLFVQCNYETKLELRPLQPSFKKPWNNICDDDILKFYS